MIRKRKIALAGVLLGLVVCLGDAPRGTEKSATADPASPATAVAPAAPPRLLDDGSQEAPDRGRCLARLARIDRPAAVAIATATPAGRSAHPDQREGKSFQRNAPMGDGITTE